MENKSKTIGWIVGIATFLLIIYLLAMRDNFSPLSNIGFLVLSGFCWGIGYVVANEVDKGERIKANKLKQGEK
jgi:drug/metabolite transporter (DMT)-like permease